MRRSILLFLVVVVIAGAVGFFLLGRSTTAYFDTDTNIVGDYVVEGRTKTVLRNAATLAIEGNLNVVGELGCENGPLTIDVRGNLLVDGNLTCVGEGSNGIQIIVAGDVAFGKDARVSSSQSVQIVRDGTGILATQDQIDRVFDETADPSDSGPRIGPFVEDGEVTVIKSSTLPQVRAAELPSWFGTVAYAHAPLDKDGNPIVDVVISGAWIIGEGEAPPSGVWVPKPPKGVNKIILNFNFGENGHMKISDFHLVGPGGQDGESDEDKSCNAKGADGKDAMRLRVQAANISLDNVILELGSGGQGGGASTKKDCDPGIAKGGNGGEAGNLKMTAGEGIVISSLRITPGDGGAGGSADAYGKDGAEGCPGEKGGDATAIGGKGGPNKKELSAAGAVSGIENIEIGAVHGGWGGDATATGGTGGNGTACKCAGGAGGKATANGGDGGEASINVGTAVAHQGASGGNGGDVSATGGTGGVGGHCPLKPSGGNGGKGGDASATEGKGAVGTTENGDPGNLKLEQGGNGGNGGDGCGPGKGGKGGAGRQNAGVDGAEGKKICPEEEKKSSGTVPSGSGNTTGSSGAGSTGTSGSGTGGSKTIQAIQFRGKYIATSELMIMEHSGCDDAPHWHSKPEPGGPVKATDGSTVHDPGPDCGFGKVSELPAMSVSVPQ